MEIIVNGQKITHIKKTYLSYSDICRYAKIKVSLRPSVTYYGGKTHQGKTYELYHLGSKVAISDGIRFHVTASTPVHVEQIPCKHTWTYVDTDNFQKCMICDQIVD